MSFSTQQATIRPLGEPGDLGWVVMAHGELYAREFGWSTEFEALVARIVTDYAAAGDPRSGAWVAELDDGERVGCVFALPGDEPDLAVLRILIVDPRARGQRLGDRLVATAVDHARDAGFARMRLWTNDVLVAARRIYLRHGFELMEATPHHSFGVDLVGQVYERRL